MDKKDLYFALPALVVAVAVGYSIGHTASQEPVFDSQFDSEVNATNPVTTVEFDERNITFMHQNDAEGKFFADITGDGSSDRDIEIIRDSSIHQTTFIGTVDGKTYFFYLRYSDDPEKAGDAWMRLYRIRAA